MSLQRLGICAFRGANPEPIAETCAGCDADERGPERRPRLRPLDQGTAGGTLLDGRAS
ncbi:MAG: hypothetical protein ACRCYQ_04800 [Nocardioides sp.]